ncbi:hypothetical protein CN918_28005 [Priestia megaterium]|nr:hypothetical protein CN918_28005 [Priestia megaterium]
MWDIIIPIVTFIGGLALGGFGASRILRKEMMKMQNDPAQIQAIAKSMGVNMSQKQLNMVTRQMQGGTGKKKTQTPSGKKKK